ncbi:hypothetical protein HGRIS_008841 [Hohenbuehelia grisea]|uniref:Uncharacterized protein n=1 Tax=Hohenbuehelia grisea TaxID=104357 RepID=A0ABR3IZS2_9AGAR
MQEDGNSDDDDPWSGAKEVNDKRGDKENEERPDLLADHTQTPKPTCSFPLPPPNLPASPGPVANLKNSLPRLLGAGHENGSSTIYETCWKGAHAERLLSPMNTVKTQQFNARRLVVRQIGIIFAVQDWNLASPSEFVKLVKMLRHVKEHQRSDLEQIKA